MPRTDARTADPTYLTRHVRVYRRRGKAAGNPCLGYSTVCAGQAANWAQLHGTSGLDVYRDYVPLCVPCHHEYDGPSSLSVDDVHEIRRRCAAGESQRSVARAFGVGQPHVSRINTLARRGNSAPNL